jgi:hypothetical protein
MAKDLAETAIERRTSPRRRLRDRIASFDRSSNPTLRRRELANLVLLVEDDLRETALALGHIERFLGAATLLLERPDLSGAELNALAEDGEVLERLDLLSDSLAQLRRRMALIAASLA